MNVRANFAKPLALKDQVYNLLRDQVRAGKFSPDDRLVDATLAKDMNISRTPVREALQLLVHEGLLETTTRGFKISELSQIEVMHLFELRLLLEPKLARKAARSNDPSSAEQLAAWVSEAAKTVDDETPERFNAAIYQFFEVLTEMCDNRAMARSVLLYHDRLAQLRVRMMAAPVHRSLAIEGFSNLVRAIQAADADASEASSEKHIRAGIDACRSIGLLPKK